MAGRLQDRVRNDERQEADQGTEETRRMKQVQQLEHGQGNCRRKRARQNNSKVEGKVRRKIIKAYSESNEDSRTGRSAHSIKRETKQATKQAAQQQNADSRHK